MALKNIMNLENYDIFSEYRPIHMDSLLFYSIPNFYRSLCIVHIHECDFDRHEALLLLLYIHVLVGWTRFEMYSSAESPYEYTIVSDRLNDTIPYDSNRIVSLDDTIFCTRLLYNVHFNVGFIFQQCLGVGHDHSHLKVGIRASIHDTCAWIIHLT